MADTHEGENEQSPQGQGESNANIEPAKPAGAATDWSALHLWQIQPLRDGVFIAAVVFIVLLGYWLSAVTVPLLIALALAYLTEPVIRRMQSRWGWTRQRSVLILLGLTLTLAAVALLVAVPVAVGQLLRLLGQIPGYLDRIQVFLAEQAESPAIEKLIETVRDYIAESERIEPGPIFSTAGEALRMVAGLIGSFFYLLLLLFLIPFYYYFFALWYPKIVSFGGELVPQANKERVFDLAKKMDRAVAGFVRGRLVICVIMGVLFSLGWWASGVPYWLLIGMIAGALNVVPYISGVVLPVAVGLLYFKIADAAAADEAVNYWRLVWPVVVFVVVQVLENWLFVPFIQGKTMNLDPVTLLVAVLAGGTIMGMYGMILAIPAAACAKILLTEVVWPRFRAWTEGREEDPLPISRE